VVLVQETVDWSQRGAVTASSVFSRNLGSTIGAALLGAVFNYCLTWYGGDVAVGEQQLRQILEGAPGTLANEGAIRLIMSDALHMTFWAVFVISACIVVAAAALPAIAARNRRPVGAE
jgi:hypothetical protein